MANDARLQIVIETMNNASGELKKLQSEIKGVETSSKSATTGTKSLKDGISGIKVSAIAAMMVVAGVAKGIKEFYKAAKEGAELEYTASKFDNLTRSINTTADALMGDLRDATSGMYSDAQLMASAGDFMALGLAKTHDEVVRLANVSGALNMNMNQLVLTLTNQTTMRFDALGVSVDGFDAKVKKLEESGLSAGDAFKEAFLQQAEQQISVVGNAADSAIGDFARMEASQKNYFDEMKRQLVEAGGWWARFWDEAFSRGNTVMVFNDLIERANKLGIDTTELMRNVTVSGNLNPTANQIAKFQPQVDALAAEVNALDMLHESLTRTGDALQYFYDHVDDDALDFAYAKTIKLSEAQKAVNEVVSVDKNFKSIIDMAYAYSDVLEQIEEKKLERDDLLVRGWSEQSTKVKALTTDIEGLEQSMKDMANQVTLDMFQATIAIGGVTSGELQAYMDMAIEMGLMSEEGAQAAIDAYSNAIQTINAVEIDDKTSNIMLNASQVWETFNLIDQMLLARQNGTINLWVKYHDLQGTMNEYEATGGNVSKGNPYIWQEYGYKGEAFVPSRDGYVLSRSDAARALSEGNTKGEKQSTQSGITINVSELVVREEADIERIAVELYRRTH